MFLICLLGFGILFGAIELSQRKFHISKELSRKLAHVGGAGGAAALPWALSWGSIFWLATSFVIIMLASRHFHVFRSIHDVSRRTGGEVFMPLAIAMLALFVQQPPIYATALVVLALSDTIAHFVGNSYGHKKLPWNSKTWLGSLAFCISTLAIVELLLFGTNWSHAALVVVAVGTTAAEAIGTGGSDNLLVPISCAGLLTLLSA